MQTLQSKQNTVLRLMFFAATSGPYTESAILFLNLLDILSVDNVYHLHALKSILIKEFLVTLDLLYGLPYLKMSKLNKPLRHL